MTNEAKILKAISEVMLCTNCPYPCDAKSNSSMANCVHHWSEILSKINSETNWKDVCDEVAYELTKEN